MAKFKGQIEIKSHRPEKTPKGLKQLDFNIERQFVSANPDKTKEK